MDLPSSLQIESSANPISARLPLDGSLTLFRGHFDGAPVLAGVVQIALVVGLVEQVVGQTLEFKAYKAVKFMKLVQPPEVLVFDVKRTAEKGLIQFCLNVSSGVCAKGTVIMKPWSEGEVGTCYA